MKVSYPVEMKKVAKARGDGLAAVSIVLPNGDRIEEQGVLTPEQCMFLKWAMAMVFCPEVRQLPGLEETIRQLMESKA